jgi:hypothetical protein
MSEKDTTGRTTPRQFRLKLETLDQMDRLAGIWGKELGIALKRADVIRLAIKRCLDREQRRNH